MPKVLESCLKDYLAKLYDVQPTDRIFPYDRGWIGRQMKFGCDHSGTQKIRMQDVRHNNATNFDSIFLIMINNSVEFQSRMSDHINKDKPQKPAFYKEFPVCLY